MRSLQTWGTARVAHILILLPCFVEAADIITDPEFLSATRHEAVNRLRRAEVFADRAAYWNDDGQGQFLAEFLGTNAISEGKIAVDVSTGSKSIASRAFDVPQANSSPKLRFLIRTDSLRPGKYTVKASLSSGGNVVEAKPCE